MPDGILTIALAVLQHRKHGVAGRIRWTQPQQAVQERHGTADYRSGGITERPSSSLAVGRAFQACWKAVSAALVWPLFERNAVQRPQLRIVGVILHGRNAELNGPVELLRRATPN